MLTSEKIRIQSVSQITASIKKSFERDYRFIHIRGEISNLRRPYSGHLYFSLKDEHAQIKAVLFKGQQKYLDRDLEDGQEVICHGRVNVYEPRGEYQLIIDTVDQFGYGELQRKFEALKRRLAEEGLFETNLKKELPVFPKELAIVTSPSGAALFDFLKIAKIRQTCTNIVVYPVRVQGAGSSEEIASAIDIINSKTDAEIIVLCRGGGSIEDLWAFNEESVARAIYQSQIPVVTGIGHEIDTTIADYCADSRASTPTRAAEMLLVDRQILLSQCEELKRKILTCMATKFERQHNRVIQCERFLKNQDTVFVNLSLQFDQLTSRFTQAMSSYLQEHFSHLQNLSYRLKHQVPSMKVRLHEQKLAFLEERLQHLIQKILNEKRAEFSKQMALLDSVSPLSVLARGYAVVTKKGKEADSREVVRQNSQVRPGDSLDIQLHKGEIECQVTGTG